MYNILLYISIPTMFNNCNPRTNGERWFFDHIKKNINTIFDVGCRQDSEFVEFEGEVHYFDPVPTFIENLSKQRNVNKQSYFNNFGLGSKNKTSDYYPRYQSFFDRVNSCKETDSHNKITLTIKKADEYMNDK